MKSKQFCVNSYMLMSLVSSLLPFFALYFAPPSLSLVMNSSHQHPYLNRSTRCPFIFMGMQRRSPLSPLFWQNYLFYSCSQTESWNLRNALTSSGSGFGRLAQEKYSITSSQVIQFPFLKISSKRWIMGTTVFPFTGGIFLFPSRLLFFSSFSHFWQIILRFSFESRKPTRFVLDSFTAFQRLSYEILLCVPRSAGWKQQSYSVMKLSAQTRKLLIRVYRPMKPFTISSVTWGAISKNSFLSTGCLASKRAIPVSEVSFMQSVSRSLSKQTLLVVMMKLSSPPNSMLHLMSSSRMRQRSSYLTMSQHFQIMCFMLPLRKKGLQSRRDSVSAYLGTAFSNKRRHSNYSRGINHPGFSNFLFKYLFTSMRRCLRYACFIGTPTHLR